MASFLIANKLIFVICLFLSLAALIAVDVFIGGNYRFLLENIDLTWLNNGDNAAAISTRIPKVVHFAIGFDSKLNGTSYDLFLFQYLAIKAARVNGKMDDVYLHYHFKPEGKWFNKSMKYITKLVQVPELPNQIFNRTIDHFAHRKDLYQLLTLLKEGGVFADMDLIILRDLDELLDNDVAIGRENYGAAEVLLNAFVVGRKSAFFLEKWLEEYRNFTNDQWTQFCCEAPRRLSEQYPGHIDVLPRSAVSTPMWDYNGIKAAFLHRTHNYSDNIATHLWETCSKTFIQNLTIEKIWALDTSLFCELRKLTADEEGAPAEITDKMKEDCQLTSKEKSNGKLLGKWDLKQKDRKFLPKLVDTSGNRMHAILSPFLGYSQIYFDAFRHNDFMAFNGDHLYLPVYPDMSAAKFTLIMWMRLPPNTVQQPGATFVSIECGDFTICMEPAPNGGLRLLRYDSRDWMKASRVGRKTGPMEADTWYLISISCKASHCNLRMNAVCFDSSEKRFNVSLINATDGLLNYKQPTNAGIGGIWLGRRDVAAVWEATHKTDAVFDVSDVRLYADNMNRRKAAVKMFSTFRCDFENATGFKDNETAQLASH